MTSFWFIAGPPFDTPMWAEVVRRMQDHGQDTHCWPTLTEGTGSLQSEIVRLVTAINASKTPIVLIGHGTALPLVIAAAQQTDVSGIVLSNGPLGEQDLLSAGLSRMAHLPKVIAQRLLSPSVALPLLASSVGLRRTVVNPYVMDRDTTVAICEPILSDSARRARVQTYLTSLNKDALQAPSRETPALLCWGDSDALSSRIYNEFLKNCPQNITVDPVQGGRFFHPVERPWELADKVVNWAATQQTTT